MGESTLSELINGWYCVNDYNALTESEKQHNANLAMKFLRQNGFTIYSAAGIVGNMWAESGLSPGQWQGDTPYSGGYGLVQWTPYTLYSEWAGTGWENNGPKQMERILYEKQNGLEFYPSQTYPQWRWGNFAQMVPIEGMTEDETVNQAASVFLYNYLRPADPSATEANRKYHARWVFHNAPGNIIPYWLLMKWANDNKKRWC